jgi:hypothetical protein
MRHSNNKGVMPGLEPGIHVATRLALGMDRRVKPGDDDERERPAHETGLQ